MGYVTGVRAALVLDLAAALPDLDVWEYPKAPDQLLNDCLLVNTVGVRPPEVAQLGAVVRFELFAVCATTTGPDAEDQLEALLDSVLIALDGMNVEWTGATRYVVNEKHPAYRIEMEV